MLKTPEPRRANTIRLPSGENAGSVADLLPVVICCRPAPFVCTRINWIGPVSPRGCAENTIQRAGLGALVAAWPATTATAAAQRHAPRIDPRRRTIA